MTNIKWPEVFAAVFQAVLLSLLLGIAAAWMVTEI